MAARHQRSGEATRERNRRSDEIRARFAEHYDSGVGVAELAGGYKRPRRSAESLLLTSIGSIAIAIGDFRRS